MENKNENFIVANSPDGGFLQSEHWRKFQEAWGRKAVEIEQKNKEDDTVICCRMLLHTLPVAGNYLYAPRGPILKDEINDEEINVFLGKVLSAAQNQNAGWIRFEPNSEKEFGLIKKNLPNGLKLMKSSVDVQPKEILILDISKSQEEILAGMKQKTRYNIRLAGKKGVSVFHSDEQKHIGEFCRLVAVTAERDKITAHPENYYRKMFEVIPSEILKLYVAEYQGKVVAANLVLFFGHTATYMHGASDNEHRNVMAPYLLQWQAILDAKEASCRNYDFGGVRPGADAGETAKNSWSGITKFKTGFAPEVSPIKFPGCYDIIARPFKYSLYRALQKIKRIF